MFRKLKLRSPIWIHQQLLFLLYQSQLFQMDTSNTLKFFLFIMAQVFMLDPHRHITCHGVLLKFNLYKCHSQCPNLILSQSFHSAFFTGIPTRAPPSFRTPPDVHYYTRPSQDFMGIQRQHPLLPNVSASQHLQNTNIPTENSAHIFPFAHGSSPQNSSS